MVCAPGPSGTGVNGAVVALEIFDDGSGPGALRRRLLHHGRGVTVNGIARWDGSAWSALDGPAGTGADGVVHALEMFDDGSGPALYAGGAFTTAGGVTVNRVARWDGSAWSPVGEPPDTGTNGLVLDLASFDDGSGPALFAGGWFTTAGGFGSRYLAAWRCPTGALFADGFEDGSTTAWSATSP